MEFKHSSVLLKETIDNLKIKSDGIYVDGTLGGGGHSYEIASRLGENGKLIGIDQDEAAIKAAGERLSSFSDKVVIVRNNYCNIKEVLKGLGITSVDGILLDLGVSSFIISFSSPVVSIGFSCLASTICFAIFFANLSSPKSLMMRNSSPSG